MALVNFDATTPVSSAYLNSLVDQVPRTAVLARSSKESEATTTSTSFVELARLKMRPVQGKYLHLDFESMAGVLGGTVRTLFEYLGGQVGSQDDATSATSFTQVTRSVNMESVGGNDLTCEDVDLVFYGKVNVLGSTLRVRSILAISSDQSSRTSSGQ